MVRLLDIDPELASRLREDDRAEARERLTLRTTTVNAGTWALSDEDPRTHPFGLVVIEGVLQREILLAGRSTLQLLGRGDLVLAAQSPSEFLDVRLAWQAATDTTVAVLDDRLQGPLALWPGLAVGLLERAGEQLTRLAIQRAIAQLPRVEDRLEATFWDLADRWGHVTPSGIHLPMQLTHDVLARLVGGRRPTISLALGALAEREIVIREPDGSWLIVAAEPSLVAHAGAGGAPLVQRIPSPEPAPAAPGPDPWGPARREGLMATARRANDSYMSAARRVLDDRVRFEATRRRSRELRTRAARERAARQADRDRRGLSPPARPAP